MQATLKVPFRLVTVALGLAAPNLSRAGVVRVPQDYLLIQQACDSAQSGDTILLGTLNDTLYVEDAIVNGKSFIFKSAGGPSKTQIRRRIIFYKASPTDTTKFIGIRWKTGSHTPALVLQEGLFEVDNCVFDSSNNCASPYGPYYTIDVGPNADVLASRCTFISQPCAVSSAYAYVGGPSTVRVSSCLFVKSCAFALFPEGGYLSAEYCCFWQNAEDADSSVDWGAGNMPFDPMLRTPDLSLLPGSPCIDAGDPDLPLDPDGSRADIGAYIPYRSAGTLHVSTAGSDDSGSGSLAEPFRTVGTAYVCSIPEDTIVLHPGTYRDHLKLERTVMLTSWSGADVTTLEAAVAGRPVIEFAAGFTSHSTISHLTIAGAQNASGILVRRGAGLRLEYCSLVGHATSTGGGLYFDSDSITVYGCEFSNNSASNRGGGVYAVGTDDVRIDSCIFHDNSSVDAGSAIVVTNSGRVEITRNLIFRNTYADGVGGPVYVSGAGHLLVLNNTVCENQALNFDAIGAGIAVSACSSVDLRNNLVSFNQGRYGIAVIGGPVGIYNEYNNVYGQWSPGIYGLTPGPGFMEADPLYDENFELTEDSPCIDAGDPAMPVPPGGGGRIDIGAFEYQKPVGVQDPTGGHRPGEFELEPNHPNPFNASTQLAYALPQAAHTRLVIHDVLGRLVATLVDGPQPAGRHTFTWDGRDRAGRAVGSGVYLVSLASGGQSEVRKLLLIK